MHGNNRANAAKFEGEVPVRNSIHGVLRDTGFAFRVNKTEFSGNELTIEWNRRPGNGSATERANVRPVPAIFEARKVAIEHFNIGEKMMAKIDRLRALEMSVSRNDHISIPFGEKKKSALEITNLVLQSFDLVAKPHSHIERHLIVARPSRMQLGSRGETLRQRRFDVHVNIFEILIPLEFPVVNLRGDLLQACRYFFEFSGRKNPDLSEHLRVGDGTADIVLPQTPVERNRLGEFGNLRIGPTLKAAAPRHWDFFPHPSSPYDCCGSEGVSATFCSALASSDSLITGAIACNLSPSSRLISFTPWVFRPASRIPLTAMRTIWPPNVISMISSISFTVRAPTTPPVLSLVFIVMMPLPPRD